MTPSFVPCSWVTCNDAQMKDCQELWRCWTCLEFWLFRI